MFGDGGLKKRILSSGYLDGVRLSTRSTFVYLLWCDDYTKKCACVNPREPV